MALEQREKAETEIPTASKLADWVNPKDLEFKLTSWELDLKVTDWSDQYFSEAEYAEAEKRWDVNSDGKEIWKASDEEVRRLLETSEGKLFMEKLYPEDLKVD